MLPQAIGRNHRYRSRHTCRRRPRTRLFARNLRSGYDGHLTSPGGVIFLHFSPGAHRVPGMQSFESTYLKYRDVVLRFAIRCASRREVAEELTAEAFLELHRHWSTIDTDQLPSWLFTVIKN